MKFLSLAFTVALAIVQPAYSQSAPSASVATLHDLIARKSVPLSLQAKDLNETYAHFQAGGDNASDASSALLRAQMGVANAFSNRVYYTKGDTLQLESGTYLVAYATEDRLKTQAPYNADGELNPIAFQPAKLRTKGKLLLSLLDLRTIGNLSDFQPFDPENDMESEADRNRGVVSTLTRLGQALQQRTYNEDEQRLPRWTSTGTTELEQWTAPYAPGVLWKHPSTDESFGLNPALSGRVVNEITNRQWVYLAYERTPAADGSRAVLFADFHVERVNAERWERVLKVAIKTAAQPQGFRIGTTSMNVVVNPPSP